MKTSAALGALAISLVLAGCSGGAAARAPEAEPMASVSTTAAGSVAVEAPTAVASASSGKPEPADALKVVPMKMIGAPDFELELKADGSVWANEAGAKSAQVATVTGSEMKIAGDAIGVWKDGTVMVPPRPAGATDAVVTLSPMASIDRFDEHDDLIVEGGGKIAIDDAGKVEVTDSDGSKEKASPAFTGYAPKAKRTAVLLALLWATTVETERNDAAARRVEGMKFQGH